MLESCWWWHQAGRRTGLWLRVQHADLAHRCTQSSQSLQMWRGVGWGFTRCRWLTARPWGAECSWSQSRCHVPCFPLLLSPARRRCSVSPSGIHCLEAVFPAGPQCQFPACVTHDRSLLSCECRLSPGGRWTVLTASCVRSSLQYEELESSISSSWNCFCLVHSLSIHLSSMTL